MIMAHFHLLSLVLFIQCAVINGYECNDAYSCAVSTLSLSVNLLCNGYYSCFNSPSLYASWPDDIYCDGSLSCQISDSISAAYANCNAFLSCAGVDSLTGAYAWVCCGGESSCSQSIISTGANINCHGIFSCSLSEINHHIYPAGSQYRVNANGALSLYNSDVNSASSGSYFRVSLYGAYSGYGSTMDCSVDSNICYIYCYGEGCNNITLVENNKWYIKCTSSNKFDNICIDGFDIQYLFGMKTILPFEPFLGLIDGMNGFNNQVIASCNNLLDDDIINCMDYEECEYDELIISHIDKSTYRSHYQASSQ